MEKAYDFKVLLDKLKEDLPDLAEEAVVNIVENVFDWLQDSAIKSENKFDDMGVAIYPIIKKYILEKADELDKEDDGR